MAYERTLAMIKPDAVAKGVVGEIIQRMEEANLKPIGMKLLSLSKARAEAFYYVHKERPFFSELVAFMSSGPIVAMCLEGHNAIKLWRETMGSTNPDEASKGTIRRDYGTDVQCNAVHGSDSRESAAFEVQFFFDGSDLVSYEWV